MYDCPFIRASFHKKRRVPRVPAGFARGTLPLLPAPIFYGRPHSRTFCSLVTRCRASFHKKRRVPRGFCPRYPAFAARAYFLRAASLANFLFARDALSRFVP